MVELSESIATGSSEIAEMVVSDGDKQLISEAFAKVQELQFQLGVGRAQWLRQESNALQQIISAEANTASVLNAVAEKYRLDTKSGQKWQFVMEKSAFVKSPLA